MTDVFKIAAKIKSLEEQRDQIKLQIEQNNNMNKQYRELDADLCKRSNGLLMELMKAVGLGDRLKDV
jgi:hypothetical protein